MDPLEQSTEFPELWSETEQGIEGKAKKQKVTLSERLRDGFDLKQVKLQLKHMRLKGVRYGTGSTRHLAELHVL